MRRVEFEVRGIPEAQGSMRAFIRNGKPVLTSTNVRLKSWRDLLAYHAADVCDSVIDGPVMVTAMFILPRPKSRPKWQIWPTSAPDLDKLTRAVGDALTSVVYRDDSQVVLWEVVKCWEKNGMKPGVRITVAELENDERLLDA